MNWFPKSPPPADNWRRPKRNTIERLHTMSDKTEKIVYISTNGGENPEKATLPFVLANAALAMDVEAVVALQGPAVTLAKGDLPEPCIRRRPASPE